MTTSQSLSVVILTFNEERNLPACLAALSGWNVPVFVVDSGSADATVKLATAAGATVHTHRFETHARQWRWALETLPLASEWVLAIDADQRVTPELRQAIDALVARPWQQGQPTGYEINRRQIFRGTWIRHGGYYPKYLLKLFRRSAVRIDDTDLVDHHFHVDGATSTLSGDLIEDNQNEARIFDWVAKHNRYAVLQARQELRERASGGPVPATRTDRRLWGRAPLLVRPCLYFFYRYVLRLGFLDGRNGFIFHVLQAFWYRLLVDVNMLERQQPADGGVLEAPSSTAPAAQTSDS